MVTKHFAIFVSLLSFAIGPIASAMVIPTAPASIAMKTLIQSRGDVIAGPFTFDDFSMHVESLAGQWSTAPSAVINAMTVRPIVAKADGIEFSGSVKATDNIAGYLAFAVDYRLTSSTVAIGGATVGLQAAALNGASTAADSLIIAPAASSNAMAHADTSWSSASPTADAVVMASTGFAAATSLDVSNVASVQKGSASVLAYAVDNVFVPEPASALLPITGLYLRRRRRTVL